MSYRCTCNEISSFSLWLQLDSIRRFCNYLWMDECCIALGVSLGRKWQNKCQGRFSRQKYFWEDKFFSTRNNKYSGLTLHLTGRHWKTYTVVWHKLCHPWQIFFANFQMFVTFFLEKPLMIFEWDQCHSKIWELSFKM